MDIKDKKYYIAPCANVENIQPEHTYALSLPVDPDDPPIDPGTAETPELPTWTKTYSVWDEEEEEIRTR